MTCIVGLERDGDVWIGGDSAGVSGLDVNVRSDEKVFFVENKQQKMLMGFTSSFRMGQLLRYGLTLPKQHKGVDDDKYLIIDFIDAVRDLYKDKGYLTKENEEESGGTFLLGYKNKLYFVDSDFQVGKPAEKYDAVGCGKFYALGVLHVLTKNCPDLDPEIILKRALDAAATHSGGVLAPYTILKLGK